MYMKLRVIPLLYEEIAQHVVDMTMRVQQHFNLELVARNVLGQFSPFEFIRAPRVDDHALLCVI
jgi:hypothetical protein